MNQEKENEQNKSKSDPSQKSSHSLAGREEFEIKSENVKNEPHFKKKFVVSSCSYPDEIERIDEESEKDFYNVPVKLTLEKEKTAIDSTILPSADSGSSENYESSIKALNKMIAKKIKKRKIRGVVEPTKISQEELIFSKSFKSMEENYSPFFSSKESDINLEQKISPSLNLAHSFKAVLKKTKEIKESLEVNPSSFYSFEISIESKINHWNVTTEMNTQVKSHSNFE